MSIIVVIEPDRGLRDALVRLATSAGACAVAFDDGAEALSYLEQSEVLPNLILLDRTPLSISAAQFKGRQDSDERLRGIPLVMLNGSEQVGSLRLKELLSMVRTHVPCAGAA